MTFRDPAVTTRTHQRYEPIAPIYDLMEIVPERLYSPWRARLWSQVEGPQAQEIGVGTGNNLPYYPAAMQITAIDLTPGMLSKARKRAEKHNLEID